MHLFLSKMRPGGENRCINSVLGKNVYVIVAAHCFASVSTELTSRQDNRRNIHTYKEGTVHIPSAGGGDVVNERLARVKLYGPPKLDAKFLCPGLPL